MKTRSRVKVRTIYLETIFSQNLTEFVDCMYHQELNFETNMNRWMDKWNGWWKTGQMEWLMDRQMEWLTFHLYVPLFTIGRMNGQSDWLTRLDKQELSEDNKACLMGAWVSLLQRSTNYEVICPVRLNHLPRCDEYLLNSAQNSK